MFLSTLAISFFSYVLQMKLSFLGTLRWDKRWILCSVCYKICKLRGQLQLCAKFFWWTGRGLRNGNRFLRKMPDHAVVKVLRRRNFVNMSSTRFFLSNKLFILGGLTIVAQRPEPDLGLVNLTVFHLRILLAPLAQHSWSLHWNDVQIFVSKSTEMSYYWNR